MRGCRTFFEQLLPMSAAPLPILHQDDHLVAVDKLEGIAVHRSDLVGSDSDYVIDRLRAQIGGKLHAVHRLDRATSGVLLFARSSEMAAALGQQMMERSIEKTYLAIVRGWPDESGAVDHPLTGSTLRGEAKPAVTRWRRLATAEVDIPLGKYPQQRYALLQVELDTGRYRQIRRHFHHVSHHVVGDTSHGRGDHNRLWRQYFSVHRLMLHAWQLRVRHPVSGDLLQLDAPVDAVWHKAFAAMGWTAPALATVDVA